MAMNQKYTLAFLNSSSGEEFVRIIGPVFEHSPWIAESTWPKRPFADLQALHRALSETVQSASQEKQLTLIRAHPDLVGRAALAGTLTPASTSEQASAGLDKLTQGEVAAFQKFNDAYHEKFGFPFLYAVMGSTKHDILGALETRLTSSRDEELAEGLRQVSRIMSWLFNGT